MYQVNQRCRFLSWTGTMNRCYWCILGLHAHAIYSDVISFCTERVLQGNTVDHFRRSWIYYSFSTLASKFLRPIYRVKSVEKQTIKPEKHHCLLPTTFARINSFTINHLTRNWQEQDLTTVWQRGGAPKCKQKILYSAGSTLRNMKHAQNWESVRQTWEVEVLLLNG